MEQSDLESSPACGSSRSINGVPLWTIYALLMMTAAGALIGRMGTVRSPRGGTPMLSANDRSRWSTVRALVDHGTYAIDQVIYRRDGRRDPEWQSIDRVRHRGWDGREHDYSSKPPLLATLIALQYGIWKALTGISIVQQPFYVMRLLLIVNHLLPLVLFWIYLGKWLDRLPGSAAVRAWVMAAATWGTFLTTFSVTLNNHLPGAISSFAALYTAWRIGAEGQRRVKWFAASGLFAAFAVTCELPALSLATLLGIGLLAIDPRRTLLGFVPAAALVAAAFWGTNYAAHGSWRPPYAHRADGPVVASLPADAWSLPKHPTHEATSSRSVPTPAPANPKSANSSAPNPESGISKSANPTSANPTLANSTLANSTLAALLAPTAVSPNLALSDAARAVVAAAPSVTASNRSGAETRVDGSLGRTSPTGEMQPPAQPIETGLREALALQGIGLSASATIRPATEPDRWVLWDSESSLRLAVRRRGEKLEFRQWDNWYEYEGTYWTAERKQGVDRGEPSRAVYAFHVLIGHRGIFSLTPIWGLSLYGFGLWLRRGRSQERVLAAVVGLVTLVCLAFFLLRPLEDRNYGGVCCGFRWLFWLIPAWLLGLQPALESCLRQRWGPWLAGTALVISIASAAYAGQNPWSHSWIYDYWTSLGWLRY